MKFSFVVAAAASLLFVGAVQAQQSSSNLSNAYGEIGYTRFDAESGGDKIKPSAVRGIVGYNIHPNFAIEGMAAFGTSSDDFAGVSVKVSDVYGVYLKPKVNVADKFELFARVGYARTKLRATYFGGSATASDSDFSYGVGATYSFTPTVYGTVDYMRYNGTNSDNVDGLTLGVGFRF